MTKYYVDKDGSYLGGFEGEGAIATVPSAAIEVSFPPQHANQKWDFVRSKWGAIPPDPPSRNRILADTLDSAPNDAARWTALSAYLRGK